MNKYVEWVNDHLTNSSLHIATLDELSEGRQFLSIMQQMTHTITATDKPLAKAIQLAEKRFGKLDGLDMKKIEEGDEKQIIAFIDLIKREEKSNAIKIQNTLSRSDSMIMSSRRRAFTVKKDGKTVPVFRNEPTVGSPSKLTQSNGQQIGRTLIAPLNLKQVINNKKEEKKSPRTPKNSNNKTPHSPHNEDNKKSPRTIQKEEREARREMKRKQIEMEKENLRKLEETRKAKTLKKEELQRMKNEMQEAIENDDETFLDLEFSSEENEIIEEEEEEEIKEVYNGVFLLDDKYYVVDPDGDGSELMELIICDVNEDVTAMARTLLISTSYQEDQIKQVKHLESVSNSITTKQVNNIIALQTQIRLWEAKQLPEIPSMKERYNMMKELKESERKYLDNLKILQTHYLKKLLEEKDDKIIKNCLKNLEMIIKYNETFIKDLTNDNKVNMYGKGVGGVFKKFTGFMKCYTLYINSHEVTNDHIVALKKKKTFAGLLTKLTTSPEVKNQTIFSYLILPIQRIPRYELFIRGMLKNIPKWSDEFGQLKEILELINKTASYLNERRREMEYKTQLKKFKHNLIIKKFDLLDKDTRRLCKYSSLECEEYGHVILFLLNDIFLIHKAKQSYSDIDALIEKQN
ncbi:Rho/RAC guanine nucleotide exchange factor [Entamoeba marina]